VRKSKCKSNVTSDAVSYFLREYQHIVTVLLKAFSNAGCDKKSFPNIKIVKFEISSKYEQ